MSLLALIGPFAFDVLHRYAQGRGMKIVRTYSDEAKNGLNIEGRGGLARISSMAVGTSLNGRLVIQDRKSVAKSVQKTPSLNG